MDARSTDESKPLINFSVFIQIDDTQNQPKVFDKDMPQDVLNEIVKHLPAKKYTPLANLSRTSTIMKKLIENTEAGQKAHQANEMKPNKLALQINPGYISFLCCCLFAISSIIAFVAVGIAKLVDALPKKSGNRVLDSILDAGLLGVTILIGLSCAVSYSTYLGLKFFSNNIEIKDAKAEQLRAEIDEPYRLRLNNSAHRHIV